MSRTTFRNTVLGIGLTVGAIALGYFGVQHFGRNNMFTIAAAVGGGGELSGVEVQSAMYFKSRTSQKPQPHQ